MCLDDAECIFGPVWTKRRSQKGLGFTGGPPPGRRRIRDLAVGFHVADDDVIQQFELKNFGCLAQRAHDVDIRGTWCRIARRMIVRHAKISKHPVLLGERFQPSIESFSAYCAGARAAQRERALGLRRLSAVGDRWARWKFYERR